MFEKLDAFLNILKTTQNIFKKIHTFKLFKHLKTSLLRRDFVGILSKYLHCGVHSLRHHLPKLMGWAVSQSAISLDYINVWWNIFCHFSTPARLIKREAFEESFPSRWMLDDMDEISIKGKIILSYIFCGAMSCISVYR